MRACTIPAFLKSGDVLYAIAPSGAVRDPAAFQVGLEEWRSRGYRVKLAPGWDDRYGYLAGTDESRRQQLVLALGDPECKGILCIRGGWGAAPKPTAAADPHRSPPGSHSDRPTQVPA